MRKFIFKKLVRDNVLEGTEGMLAKGAKPIYRTVVGKEFISELCKKISEEAEELPRAANNEIAEEVADIKELVEALETALNISPEVVTTAKLKKASKVGGYKKGVYIDSVEVPDDYPWIKHYLDQPDKYPEITSR